MASEPNELRRINWGECFPFTHIFRAFRIAIHPSKLGLALAGLVLMGIWGSLLDRVWSSKRQPLENELKMYCRVPDIGAWREEARKKQASLLLDLHPSFAGKPRDQFLDAMKSDPAGTVDEALKALVKKHEESVKAVNKGQAANKDEQLASVVERDARRYREIEAMRPVGIFHALMRHEAGSARQAIQAAISLNFTGGLDAVLSARHAGSASAVAMDNPGVLASLAIAARGFQWLIAEHWFYALLFGVVSLAIWSLFGGAICRMAAMNVAREERLSPKSALAFSQRKLMGFFTAPLMPMGAVIGIGLLIAVGSILLAIPYLGDLVGGIGMILALVGGFIIAMVIIGGLAGGSLMWPTIAVEGSDGFDAFSRSYNYIYSRPWRAAFYGAVSLVYGGICFVFSRFFVLLMLKATRFFVAIPLGWFTGRPGTGFPGASKIATVWPEPTFASLRGETPIFGALHWDGTAAWFIGLWILLLTALLWSLLVSFYFSSSTIIYYLLRREVDATDIEDIFVDEEDEPEPAFAPPAAPTPAPVAPAPVVEPPPPPVPPPAPAPEPGPQ